MGIRELAVVYGQTEASPVITCAIKDDPPELRVGTIGCVMPNTEIKAISPSGETAQAGEQHAVTWSRKATIKSRRRPPVPSIRRVGCARAIWA